MENKKVGLIADFGDGYGGLVETMKTKPRRQLDQTLDDFDFDIGVLYEKNDSGDYEISEYRRIPIQGKLPDKVVGGFKSNLIETFSGEEGEADSRALLKLMEILDAEKHYMCTFDPETMKTIWVDDFYSER